MKLIFALLCFAVALPILADDEKETFRERLLSLEAERYEDQLKSGRVITDAELNDFLDALVKKLDPQVDSPIPVVILREHAASAWVNASNRMYVTTGLLATLSNVDQLAFVMAHELAHVELDHVIDGFLLRKKELEGVNRRLWWGGQFEALASSAKYSREQETAADVRATEMIIASGYSREKAAQALYRLAEIDAAIRSEHPAELLQELKKLLGLDLVEAALQTHPHILERYDAARGVSKEQEQEALPDVEINEQDRHYWQLTRSIFNGELQFSRLRRDGSRLRVYLTGNGAKERFGVADYYFWMSESFRLDGNEDEREKVGSLHAGILQKYPDHTASMREYARQLHLLGNEGLAQAMYSQFRSRQESTHDAHLDHSIGAVEIPVWTPLDNMCESSSSIHNAKKLGLTVSIPCDWNFITTGKSEIGASRNGKLLDYLWISSRSDKYGYAWINEEISDDTNLDELLEMERALSFKQNAEGLPSPGNTGIVTIGERHWAWFEYEVMGTDGVEVATRHYVTRVDDGAVKLGFSAVKAQYFDRYIEDAERVLRALRFEKKKETE